MDIQAIDSHIFFKTKSLMAFSSEHPCQVDSVKNKKSCGTNRIPVVGAIFYAAELEGIAPVPTASYN
ncbi:hypothetical protein P7H25_24945 [Paenibacillus larvae]|nr:hypothetical protein [Paenibacillus larvae]MDT2258130.1 hypothetical protein [Paenibacillus larvae]